MPLAPYPLPVSFHLGKPILVMLVLAAIGALVVTARPARKRTPLNVWVYAESHQRAYTGRDSIATGEATGRK